MDRLIQKSRNQQKLAADSSGPKLRSMLREGMPMLTVWPISNGYLLVGSDDRMLGNTIVYVKDVSEIGEQIAAMKARVAIGVPSNVGVAISNTIGFGKR